MGFLGETNKDVLYKKTGIAKPDAKTLMLDAMGMLPTLMGAPISVTKALQQLGKSAVGVRKLDVAKHSRRFPDDVATVKDIAERYLPPVAVRDMAASIKGTPKEILEPLTSVRYTDRLPSNVTGRNVRVGFKPEQSKIQLAPEALAREWWHETAHSSAYAGQAGARAEGKPNLFEYMSDLLESTTTKADEIVAKTPSIQKTKSGAERSFYKNQPIETHARGMAETLTNYGEPFTNKQHSRLFINKAKQVMRDVKKKAPKLYKQSAKELSRRYRSIRETDAKLMRDLKIKSPKSKITRRKRSIRKGIGTKRYTEADINKIIKRITPKRKAD